MPGNFTTAHITKKLSNQPPITERIASKLKLNKMYIVKSFLGRDNSYTRNRYRVAPKTRVKVFF